jgi:hypothetical protein
MKQLLVAAVLALFLSNANAAVPIPPDLVGVWSSDGAVFRGEAIWNGSAIYLDVDGVGAFVGGDGTDVLGVRFVITNYNAITHTLSVDLTENGKVLKSADLIYNPERHTISSPADQNRTYHKHSDSISSAMREKGLGLEPVHKN